VAVDRDKLLQTAQRLVEKKRYDKAIAEYQKLVADDPKDVRTLLKIGDLYLRMDQYVEAIATYEGVGQFYSQQGFALKAIAVYKQIREIIHKHVPHLEDRFGHIVPRLAELYTQLGLTSDALATYDEVATRLQRAGRDRDAIDIFKKIVDLDPNNPLPYLRLAEAFVRLKEVDNAIQRFGVAAEILLRLGRPEDALKVVERLLQHRAVPKFAQIAAIIYLERGGPNDGMAALTKLQICFKENPKDLDTLGLLSRAFDALGQPAKAVEVQKEAARIAKEVGRHDVYDALVDVLLARAPDDDTVAILAAQRTSPPSTGAVEIEVEEAEELFDEDVHSEHAFSVPQDPIPSYDPAARVRHIVTQVEALRRAKDYSHAIVLLREGIAENPSARELREKICDVLLERGDQEGAIRQMLIFAQRLSLEGDVEGAARVLEEVLLLEPSQSDAIQMLRSFGYTMASEIPAPSDATYHEAYGGGGYDPDAPLPSYDLDDTAGAPLIPRVSGLGTLSEPQLDDPFGSDLPLPSFPIEEPALLEPVPSQPQPKVPTPTARDAQAASTSFPRTVRTATQPAASVRPVSTRPAAPPPPVSGSGSPSQFDEDALEEVEFFISQGEFGEARALLQEQLQRLPNHPLLLERLREVDALAPPAAVPTAQESGARPRPAEQPGEDRSYDIAEILAELDELEMPAPTADPQQVSVDQVFEQFKAGVAAQISESDASTHYDLGVAYREMGLFPDAISEFQLAARDPGRECVCNSMIGTIHLQLGDVESAIDAFIRALHASHRTKEQEIALNYEIGDAYESRRVSDQALYYFQNAARIDPRYRDPRGTVEERMRRLQPAPKPPPAKAVGAEMILDDFDSAFDDLLSAGKLP
jgi:tetratricopeptide (TPR) repeat protein